MNNSQDALTQLAASVPGYSQNAATLSTSRAELATFTLRELITAGELTPGMRLPEIELAEKLGVSRNTLREAFRLLSQEKLIEQIPHRGAFVATPTLGSIIDIYRVRRVIELQALRDAEPLHDGVARMAEAVREAEATSQVGDWRGVGTANMRFHSAIVSLTDSARLAHVDEQISAELRLAFGVVDNPEYLHAAFLGSNAQIHADLSDGRNDAAVALLEDYLLKSERMLIAAYSKVNG